MRRAPRRGLAAPQLRLPSTAIRPDGHSIRGTTTVGASGGTPGAAGQKGGAPRAPSSSSGARGRRGRAGPAAPVGGLRGEHGRCPIWPERSHEEITLSSQTFGSKLEMLLHRIRADQTATKEKS